MTNEFVKRNCDQDAQPNRGQSNISSAFGGGFYGYEIGEVIGASSAAIEKMVTSLPEPYTQDTLLDAMVNASKFSRNEAEREILLRCNGLGTSRTRIPMIESLVDKGLLVTRNVGRRWEIHISDIGYTVLDRVPAEVKSVAMTARWEIALSGIREGKYTSDAIVSKGYELVKRMVEHLKSIRNSSFSVGQNG